MLYPKYISLQNVLFQEFTIKLKTKAHNSINSFHKELKTDTNIVIKTVIQATQNNLIKKHKLFFQRKVQKALYNRRMEEVIKG